MLKSGVEMRPTLRDTFGHVLMSSSKGIEDGVCGTAPIKRVKSVAADEKQRMKAKKHFLQLPQPDW